jgi:hypothetical protein
MFLVSGGMTVASGILFAIVMPNDPSTAWFLTARERDVAVARLALDRATRDRTDFSLSQAREALIDPRTWLYAVTAMCAGMPTAINKV